MKHRRQQVCMLCLYFCGLGQQLFVASDEGCSAARNEYCVPGDGIPRPCPAGFVSTGGPDAPISGCSAVGTSFYFSYRDGVGIAAACPPGYASESAGQLSCMSCNSAASLLTCSDKAAEIIPWCEDSGRLPTGCVALAASVCGEESDAQQSHRVVGNMCCRAPRVEGKRFVQDRTGDPADACRQEWVDRHRTKGASITAHLLFSSERVDAYDWTSAWPAKKVSCYVEWLRSVMRARVVDVELVHLFDNRRARMVRALQLTTAYSKSAYAIDVWEALFPDDGAEPMASDLFTWNNINALKTCGLPHDVLERGSDPTLVFEGKGLSRSFFVSPITIVGAAYLAACLSFVLASLLMYKRMEMPSRSAMV